MKRQTLAVVIAGLAGLSGGLVTAVPAAAQTPDGAAHYVDCSAATPGDGTAQSPWNSLSQVNAQTFGPGQELLFKRGVQCVGELEPHGSGSVTAPFVISDYGAAPARAAIEGAGAEAAVKLYNEQNITLSDLEITNSAAPPSQRRGVLVQLQDYGVGHGYLLKNLDVHNVLGGDLKGPTGSQGIAFTVTGSRVPTSFDGVNVVGNQLDHIDRQGIVIVLSTWSNRPEVGSTAPENWVPSTHVVVERNALSDIGGDGIVMNTTDGALVQRNTVSGFHERSAAYNAGIWDFNTDNSLLQYNDVSGGRTHLDGMAYDVDQGNIATTFQYNYSHDNEGGFFLLCNNGPGVIRDAVVRYNFSWNDSYRGVENCRGAIESAQFTNNIIYIGDGVSQTVVNENTTSLRNVAFDNNLVYKTGAGVADFNLQSGGYTFAGNVFIGVQNPPQQATAGPGVGLCAAGATSGHQAVTPFQLLTHGRDGNVAALVSGVDLSRYFGASSSVTAPRTSSAAPHC